MKLCKKCKKKVANKAQICKYCGADVTKAKIIKTDTNKTKKTTTKKATINNNKNIENEKKEEKKVITQDNQIKETKTKIKKALELLKKYIIIFIKFIVKISKKAFNKLKIIINKLDKKIEKKTNKKELEDDEYISKKSGIVTDTLAQKENFSYETTRGIPVIVQESNAQKENINLKEDLRKIKEKIDLFKEKHKIKKQEKEQRKLEIKNQEIEENQIEEDEETEYEGISIKKIILFILILIIIGSLIFVLIKKNSFHHDDEPQTKITEKNMGKTFDMNEAIFYQGVKYKVTKAETSEGTEYRKPKEGNEYVVVTIHFENQSKDKQKYSYKNWKMTNSKKEEKSRIFTPINVETALYSGTLVVGSEKDGSLVFEQPKDDQELILNFYSDQQLFEMEKEKNLIEKEVRDQEQSEEKKEIKQPEKKEPIFKVRIKISKTETKEKTTKSETEA